MQLQFDIVAYQTIVKVGEQVFWAALAVAAMKLYLWHAVAKPKLSNRRAYRA
jgi:hypothetical protein